MAYALVKAGTIATTAPAFGQATTAGNLLILLGWMAEVSITGWSFAEQTSTATAPGGQIWFKANCAASETAPSVPSGTATMLVEFSGGATTSPLDQHKQQSHTINSPIVPANAVADVAAGELVIVVITMNLSKAGTASVTDTFNNGATATNLANNDATSTANHYNLLYGVTTGNSAGDQDTHTEGSMNLAELGACIASFKLGAVVAHSLVTDNRRTVRNSLLRR